MKQQSGFTLIELIIVIVILGILAATALPKFADLKTDANNAAMKGLAGSMTSAATIAHATYLAKGTASNVPVTLEGIQVTMLNGYPDASASGIGAAVTSSDYTWQAATPTPGLGKTTVGNNCYVGYSASVGGALPAIGGAASSIAGC